MHNFTLEDLISYHYNELSSEKSVAIKEALRADNQLQTSYLELTSAINSLAKVQLSPDQKTVRDIESYAHKLMEELHSH
jgi:hypothetical protein